MEEPAAPSARCILGSPPRHCRSICCTPPHPTQRKRRRRWPRAARLRPHRRRHPCGKWQRPRPPPRSAMRPGKSLRSEVGAVPVPCATASGSPEPPPSALPSTRPPSHRRRTSTSAPAPHQRGGAPSPPAWCCSPKAAGPRPPRTPAVVAPHATQRVLPMAACFARPGRKAASNPRGRDPPSAASAAAELGAGISGACKAPTCSRRAA
mmetsp:Transcript_129395/g.374733  ORF Transcript_129395/g.374733 Transcript_129395/m.374733 type:complete len:208 (+) Transcript_129395:1114-1737(+)